MKKGFSALFSLMLVIGLLLAPSSIAKAAADDAPVVTPVSGDMDFSTSVVSTGSLPGTTQFHLMPVPVGFPAGEAQYGGDGVLVTKMDYGKASACFSIATAAVNQGWGGKVGVWNGTKWVLLATTITPQDESATSLACATISGNGTYAFIKWIADASKLPTCSVDTSSWVLNIGFEEEVGNFFYAALPNVPNGTPVTLTFVSATNISYTGFKGHTNALIGDPDYPIAYFYDSGFQSEGSSTITLRLTAVGCSAERVVPYEIY